MAQCEGQTLNSQAAMWLARLQREELAPSDRAELERWLDANPAHAVAFARVEYAWDRAERLRAIAPQAHIQKMPVTRKTWALAAVLVLALLGGSLGYYLLGSDSYMTAIGERRTIALDDGSQVQLNTESRIEVAFERHARTVRLKQGEALFKVAHDSKRPFVVDVGGTLVQAMGTAFNIRLRERVVEVTVTEGLVAVNANNVPAGSAAIVAGGAVNRVELQQDALRRRVAWREDVIEFRGETLEQAVEEFNRYRKTKLVVADPAIAELRVGGRFGTDEGQKFLNGLKISFGIRIVKGEGGVLYVLGREN